MTARERLVAVAAEHGHDPASLALICEATFPTHTPGETITDDQVAALADSIDVLGTAGLAPGELASAIEHHKDRHGPGWRESFWRRWCRMADRRAHAGAKARQPVKERS